MQPIPKARPKMRPRLNPALRRLWRDEQTLQLGVDPLRSVIVEGVNPELSRYLLDLAGQHDWPAAIDRAADFEVSRREAEQLLGLLFSAGALIDCADDQPALSKLTAAERDRLAPDLAAWSLIDPQSQGAARTLHRRSTAWVEIVGAGRVGAALAPLLAAAGIGQVEIVDHDLAVAADLGPGGLDEQALGRSRGRQAQALVARIRPSMRRRAPRPLQGATLTVLCPVEPQAARAVIERRTTRGIPHLFAGLVDNVGTIGPLVLPGRSPCLRCLDLHRTDRDPRWPLIAAQLFGDPPKPFLAACDVALAAAVTAQAALAVLAYIDAPEVAHPLIGGVAEVRPRQLSAALRLFDAHPFCGCSWTGAEPVGRVRGEPVTMGT